MEKFNNSKQLNELMAYVMKLNFSREWSQLNQNLLIKQMATIIITRWLLLMWRALTARVWINFLMILDNWWCHCWLLLLLAKWTVIRFIFFSTPLLNEWILLRIMSKKLTKVIGLNEIHLNDLLFQLIEKSSWSEYWWDLIS